MRSTKKEVGNTTKAMGYTKKEAGNDNKDIGNIKKETDNTNTRWEIPRDWKYQQ